MYKINPGEFKHLINIYSESEFLDSDNIPQKKPQIILQAKAKVLNLSGKETILNNNTIATDTKRFYIRYKNIDINTNCNLKYKKNIYNIIYISNVEEKDKYFEIVGELVK